MLIDKTFVFSNETKGAIRYGEVLPNGRVAQAPNDPGATIGVLYLRKSELPPNKSFPTRIRVQVEELAEERKAV